MIPRLHPRGSSFRGACDYVLHDMDKATTSGRVPWCMTVNLSTQDPRWAWHEMVDTYWAQGALKAASGIDQRGRKNDKPVLHLSLSWAASETPSPEEMQKAALSSLKAMGLAEHQALITAHTDKAHAHVHIVVNTIHPTTGKTAPLKFTKLELSRWAEAYEVENGIHCEERIRNNKTRRRNPSDLLMDELKPSERVPAIKGEAGKAAEREAQRLAREQRERWLRKRAIRNLGPDGLLGNDADKPLEPGAPSLRGKAYRRRHGYIAPSRILLRRGTREPTPEGVPTPRRKITPEEARARDPMRRKRKPILLLAKPRRRPEPGIPRVRKYRSDSRRIWLEKKDVVDRMKRMRAEAEVLHKIDRNATWVRHKQERDQLWQDSNDALRQANAYFSKKFKPVWRDLYKAQREEMAFIEKATPLERAVFVFTQDRRLGGGQPLSVRDRHAAITRPGRLMDLLERAHERERTALAQVQKAEAHVHTSKVLDTYARRQNALLSRQTDEREAQRAGQQAETRKVTFEDARKSLNEDLDGRIPERKFKRAPEQDAGDAFEKASDGSSADTGGSAPPPPDTAPDRADEIRRDMAEWRKRNKGSDYGREM